MGERVLGVSARGGYKYGTVGVYTWGWCTCVVSVCPLCYKSQKINHKKQTNKMFWFKNRVLRRGEQGSRTSRPSWSLSALRPGVGSVRGEAEDG